MKLISISTPGDGSCFYHSILKAFNKTYNNYDNYTDKKSMVMELRKTLSEVLDEKLKGKTVYERLGRGTYKDLSKELNDISLPNMKKALLTEWGDIRVLELISNSLNIDIYVLNKDFKIYNTGDYNIYIKNRDSIIIRSIDNYHFETVGLKKEDYIQTLFDTNDELIMDLKKEYKTFSKKDI